MASSNDWMYHNLREHDTRWTPVTPQVRQLIFDAYIEAERNWEELARIIDVKSRYLRRLRNGRAKVVSLKVMDRILAKSERAHEIHNLPWYTIEELVEMGIWRKPWGLSNRDTDTTSCEPQV